MKIANIFIEKILKDNALIADLATTFRRSLQRTEIIIERNEINGRLTTVVALGVISSHLKVSREELLEQC